MRNHTHMHTHAERVAEDTTHTMTISIPEVADVAVDFELDPTLDMFQAGRNHYHNDIHISDIGVNPSRVSRYAMRVMCMREPPHSAFLYAAGFDGEGNLFLGE